MSQFIDLIKKRFGKLTVVRRVTNTKDNKARWLCLCDCGSKKNIIGCDLRNGHTKSCGCLHIMISKQQSITHGHSQNGKPSKTYMLWTSIKQRCTNPNFKQYKDYGGRGIAVCERWENSFESFLEDMGEVPVKNQIDRIDNNGDYCKTNCRWTTPKQNSRNRRDNRLITHNEETQCLAAWEEKTGISCATIRWRLNHDWLTEKA